MKNRNIPFGYKYENGIVVEYPKESEALRMICKAYLAGQSLFEISTWLNENAIEYMPAVVGWNKSRIMRMMEDTRYLGTAIYPALLDAATYEAIQHTKSSKNTQKDIDRSADIFSLSAPVICPKCGSEMHRRYDSRCRCRQRWTCKNDYCRQLIVLADEDLLSQITAILNQIITDPRILAVPAEITMKDDPQTIKLENEINRILGTTGYDKAELRQKMTRWLSFKYKTIDHHAYTIQQMKVYFEKSSLLSSFSADLADRTVKHITLNTDGTIYLTLINNQTIGKELLMDARCHKKHTT